jgi:hypothetical protein
MRWTAILSLSVAAWCGCDAGAQDHTLVLTGSACGVAIEYDSGDVAIQVVRDQAGDLLGIIVADGEPFDVESDAEWARYASQHEVYSVLWFHDPEPATPHSVTKLENSVIGARGVGVIGLEEDGRGELIAIDDLDFDAGEIALHMTLPVYSHNSDYPPTPGGYATCQSDIVSGSITGPFREIIRQEK